MADDEMRANMREAVAKDLTVTLNEFVDHLRAQGFSVYRRLYADGNPAHQKPDLDRAIKSFVKKRVDD